MERKPARASTLEQSEHCCINICGIGTGSARARCRYCRSTCTRAHVRRLTRFRPPHIAFGARALTEVFVVKSKCVVFEVQVTDMASNSTCSLQQSSQIVPRWRRVSPAVRIPHET